MPGEGLGRLGQSPHHRNSKLIATDAAMDIE